MIRFATLGPGGTNHELVTQRYIDFHKLKETQIIPVGDFSVAAQMLKDGEVDYVVQCAVHPDTPNTLGNNFRRIYVVDTFISPSKDLAVLTRKDVDNPKTIGAILPATEGYADLSRWETKVPMYSIPVIVDKMLAGDLDSGLVYLEYVERYPGKFRIDQVIGSPDDAWIVYGLQRTYKEGVQAWADSPIASQFKKLEGK
jgi:hypothetical protein